MTALSKSKIIACRQCPKRLWLELNEPGLLENSTLTDAKFAVGNQVGAIAQKLFDPAGKGVEVNRDTQRHDDVFKQTAELLKGRAPIFEAGFTALGAKVFADVILPVGKGANKRWRMIEVKSSASVKAYHQDDAAIQAYVVQKSGLPLASISVAHIDTQFVYSGGDRYNGLLKEADVTEHAASLSKEVEVWINDAQAVAAQKSEPNIKTGRHCVDPYACGFLEYCQSQEPQPEFPVSWLPRLQKKDVKEHIESKCITDMSEVPDEMLNDTQRRVKAHTLSGITYFDSMGAARALAQHTPPLYFLDFETINLAVPIWKGTRPFQQIPFQLSCHHLTKKGELKHASFLDLSGGDPSKAFADAVITVCGEKGAIFVYNMGFEKGRIKDLAERFPKLRNSLEAVIDRLVDLLPIAASHYYHPSQQGSWSIKAVLPAVVPSLDYNSLNGVQDGTAAMLAFQEAIDHNTAAPRKAELAKQLEAYCKLDTYAMVRLWQVFANRNDLKL